MADAGVLCGLPHSLSLELTCKTFMGSAKMILESGSHPASLRTLVCTPGGLSIAGISALEEHKVRSAIFKAVEAASGLKKDS